MFTGIIEALGKVISVTEKGTNYEIWIESPLSDTFSIDQSVSHDGVCLTVDALRPGAHRLTAIAETLEKSTIKHWKPGYNVNIERCTPVGSRYDGHIVQGHVDCTATCTRRTDKNGSWEFRFEFPAEFSALIVEKGSIAVNGTSLTIFDIGLTAFSVAIIPYTFENTTIGQVSEQQEVNIEFDLVGKYIRRLLTINALSQ
ncbi:riboflavin synthase [Flavihumibacter petaseus]|uniref:Riboflavin synthase n=1 Tax=Flavihumibacter petaseus NBRC 106054 TaxID=1220578 RepID=A0A0E9MTU1_9BACT|nr:riboflavin synthase [Flavihumibacter petaseus]GAO41192.1 riboflavin synthase [Flavihumibacter petaseus NBRC 106054]